MKTERIVLWALSLAACSSWSRVPGWQDALSKTQLSLGDAANAAERPGERAVRAVLEPGRSPMFFVDSSHHQAVDDVRVDGVTGDVLWRASTARTAASCPGAVSLADAIAAAEDEVNGDAVRSGPDDDDACDTEVIVLAGDTPWEVKIGPDGSLVEPPEKADDDEGTDSSGG